VDVFAAIESANRAYVDGGEHRSLPVRPSRQVAVVTCMDARIPVFPVAGLELGDAHVIRTAGGRVTEDVLRSLALSTHVLGVRAVAVVAHTDCGVRDPDGSLERRLQELMGHPPTGRDWYTFADPVEAVRGDCERLLRWEDRPAGLQVGGYVLDVETGALDQVFAPAAAPDPV
jgi:carbonic anhydrase